MRALGLTFMDNSPVAGMGALWTKLGGQRRPFEIVLVVPREDVGEPLVPHTLPPEVPGCWSADQVIVSAIVLASGPTAAIAAVEALVPELARASGAAVTVRAADAAARARRPPPLVRLAGSGCRLDAAGETMDAFSAGGRWTQLSFISAMAVLAPGEGHRSSRWRLGVPR